MISQVTIDKMTIKEGRAADGRQWFMMNIRGADGNWYSTFKSKWNQDWREGDSVTADVVEKEKNGKKFLNLENPNKSVGHGYMADNNKVLGEIDNLAGQIRELKAMLSQLAATLLAKPASKMQPLPDFDAKANDIPF